MELNKKVTILLLLLIMFFALLIRLPFLSVPLTSEEGEIAYIAQQMGRGDVPYQDAIHQKTPGMFYVYLFIFKTLGKSVEDIRLFAFLYTLFIIISIYKLSSLLFGRLTGLFSAFLFSLISNNPHLLGFIVKAEIFMLLPVIISIIYLYLAIKKQSKFLFFLCGIFNGIAFILKQTAIFNWALVYIFLLINLLIFEQDKKYTNLIKKYLFFSFGLVVSIVPIFIYFGIKAGWHNFFYWTIFHNFFYVGNFFILKNIPPLLISWGNLLIKNGLIFLLVIIGFWQLVKIREIGSKLLLTWAVISAVGVGIGQRYFLHYVMLILAPFSIISGVGVCFLFEKINAKFPENIPKKIISIILIWIVVLFYYLISNYKFLFIYSPDQISRQIYALSPYVEAKEVADYLNGNTSPKDTIAILGSEPEILFYAQRKSATKYIILYPLMGNYKDALERQKEMVQEIMNNRPKYILAINVQASVGKDGHTNKYIFEKMFLILETDYYLEGLIFIEQGQGKYTLILGEEQMQHAYKYLHGFAPIMIYRRK